MSPRRDDSVRLRPVRAVWFAVSVTMTMLAVVAATGLLPTPSIAAASASHHGSDAEADEGVSQSPDPDQSPGQDQRAGRTPRPPVLNFAGAAGTSVAPAATGDGSTPAVDPAPPADSGSGRRVVFDLSAQRVWLVGAREAVRSTYLVSGSVTDNLGAGSYEVYSRSEHATSYDYSSTMRWMVRFTQGRVAAIGFHAIPRDHDGEPVQTLRQLGTPTSHGCIRQRPRDAKALWDFAPVGTPVVVVA